MQLRLTTHTSLFLLLTACGTDPGNPEPPEPTLCDETPFRECGGDLSGTWSTVASCGPVLSWSGPFVDHPACGDSTIETFTYTHAMTMRFDVDETYRVEGDFSFRALVMTDPVCLDAISNGQGTPENLCAQIKDQFGATSCVVGDHTCDCVGPIPASDTGRYSIIDNFVTIWSDTPGEPPTTIAYCVDGDKFLTRDTEEDETAYEVMVRQ